MRFYPNPVSGFLQVQSLTGRAQGFTITGMDGRNWMQFRLEGGTQQAIDLRHMPAGIYVLSGEGESRMIILTGNP
jgi:hypothetical protein